MFTIIDGIRTLIDGNTLTSYQTQNVMEAIMDGQTDPTQIASFLTALWDPRGNFGYNIWCSISHAKFC